MAFAEDLLRRVFLLLNKESKNPWIWRAFSFNSLWQKCPIRQMW